MAAGLLDTSVVIDWHDPAVVAALDCLLDDIGTDLSPADADMVIDYAATRFERGEVDGALSTLTMACDMTGAYRLAAVMHTAEVLTWCETHGSQADHTLWEIVPAKPTT